MLGQREKNRRKRNCRSRRSKQALEAHVEKDLEDMEGLKETIADLEVQLEEVKLEIFTRSNKN